MRRVEEFKIAVENGRDDSQGKPGFLGDIKWRMGREYRVGVFIVGWGCFCLVVGYFLSFAQHYRYKFRQSRKPNPGQESSIGVLPGRKENRAKDLRILQENNQSDESCSLYVPVNTNFGLNTYSSSNLTDRII